MKLIVLAGAKQGAEIPLKKEKFLIGRASDCTLRGGSDAISRHHCLLVQAGEKVTVRDLGSRNGTYVNEQKTESETPLHHGDELRIGPLKFRFHNEHEVKLANARQPKVKNVADALARTASLQNDDATEDDISRWLIGPDAGSSKAAMETQTFKLDETRAMGVRDVSGAAAEANSSETVSPDSTGADSTGDDSTGDDSTGDDSTGDDSTGDSQAAESGNQKKKGPGKLPPIPPKPMAKDSGEAAAGVLREMARRR